MRQQQERQLKQPLPGPRDVWGISSVEWRNGFQDVRQQKQFHHCLDPSKENPPGEVVGLPGGNTMARRTPGIRSPSVRTGSPGSAILTRAKATGIRTPKTQNRQLPMDRARRATGNVGTPQQKMRSVIGGKVVTSSKSADAMRMQQRKPASSLAGAKPGIAGIATASRQMGSPAASAIASLARPLKRKPTRGGSRGSSRR